MPNKTFTSTTLTASELNDYFMEQVIVTCTSGTRPTGIEGRVIYETDTDKLLVYSGSTWREFARSTTWTAFTPSWTNLSLGDGTNDFQYKYVAGDIRIKGKLTFGTTTSISGTVSLTIPNSETSSHPCVGCAQFVDSSTGTEYEGTIRAGTSSTLSLFFGNNLTATNPVAYASTDELFFDITVSL